MKKILGLDLGSSSIGWAYVEENGTSRSIKKLGVRIVPIDSSARDAFAKGQAITINKDRTLKRTARKTNHRYKLRKKALITLLSEMSMLPGDDLQKNISSFELYGLRDKATREKITLQEIGRILFHLNQKRGYRSSRKGNQDDGNGKKLSDYLQEIKGRKDFLEENKITIGQYFYQKLKEDQWHRIKDNVFPRECYMQEFETIWEAQKAHHPKTLTEDLKKKIKEEIIFYQRPLKSAKWLVGECRFEKHHKVTPISSPLFQVEKIWESIHNISLTNKRKEVYPISWEQKQKLFTFLDNHEKLTATNLFKELGLKSTDGWYANDQIKKAGLQGNITKCKITKAFKDAGISRPELLEFKLNTSDSRGHHIDSTTGEVIPKMIDGSFEKEPLYQLWHVLYSIEDPVQTVQTLVNRFNLNVEEAQQLAKLDFTQAGFGNKSARAIRKLLPALMSGKDYTQACALTGYSHSDSLTKEQNENRLLEQKLEHYSRNSLRQPVVEKILNQLVNVVNAILSENELGRPDEIRIELARELKQSKDERDRAYKRNNETDRINKYITDRLNKEFPGLIVTKKILEKYKLHEQQNGLCLYSGENISLAQALRGENVDVDHIIPQSRLFDDSFQNKVLVFRKENAAKDNATAFDFMKSKGDSTFQQYIESVNRLFDAEKITRSKRDKLLTAAKDIPDDFINRQLNESRFIAKEATKLLKTICRNVFTTTGSVTEFLRHQWGYNEVLKQLNWKKYEEAELVKDGKIEGWSKRDDHRHHAIDALVVACTKQGYIQKLNTLNSEATRNQLLADIAGNSENGWQAKRSLLEQSIYIDQPFSTQAVKEAVDQILISQKPGKRVGTYGKNKVGSTIQRTLTPRGFLHKETVYGKIKRYSKEKAPLNTRFTKADLIVNESEKQLVIERLAKFGNDPKLAFKNLEKNPIWKDKEQTKLLTAVTVWEEFYVVKYALGPGFKEKDIDSIIDEKIKEKIKERFAEKGNNALKDLENDPIWLNKEKRIPIKTVRCFTGLNDLTPLHITENGKTFSKTYNNSSGKPVDFISTRNNHHIAIYQTPEGKLEELSVTLWDAVCRKQAGLPAIITNPTQTWDYVLNKGIEDQSILSKLPGENWKLIQSLQQNEMFVFRMTEEDLKMCINEKAFHKISPNLYRLQKISEKDYVFRHHLETRLEKDKIEESVFSRIGKFLRIRSLDAFSKENPIKVKLNHIGQIQLE